MPYFKYNKEAQDKYSPSNFEPFLKVEKEKLFAIDPKKDGDYRIRLLPPWSPEGAFAKGTRVHFGIGLEKRVMLCPNILGEDLCPFCRVHSRIKQDEMFKADTDAIRPAPRYYSNIVNMKEPHKGVLVWGYGPQIYFPIKKVQDSGEFGDVTDPTEGRDLIINRQVRGKVTDSVYPANKISMLQNPDWLDQMVDLDTILPEPDVQLVEKLFKSQPWKVYEPTVKVVVQEQLKQVFENTSVAAETTVVKKQPVVQTQTDVDDKMAKINDLEARLRAKMQAKQQQVVE